MKNNLTAIEIFVLELTAERMNNKKISEKLDIPTDDVKIILESIYSKIGVNNRLQAILKYYL